MIKALRGYILIKPVEKDIKTVSGIYLPENSTDKPEKGLVISIGENTKDLSSPVEVGQTILYKKWSGNETKLDGEKYIFVKFEDCMGVIE